MQPGVGLNIISNLVDAPAVAKSAPVNIDTAFDGNRYAVRGTC